MATIKEIEDMITNNSNYWEKRSLESTLQALRNEDDYARRLQSIYDEATRQIDQKMAAVYQRYAKNNKMTLEDAYKQLPKDIESKYVNDLYKYINTAKQHAGDPAWTQHLINQSAMRKHSVLDMMRTQLREVVYNIDNEETGGKFLEKIYQNSNYKTQYDFSQTAKKEDFVAISEDKVKQLINENWSGGGSFSQLIWKNKDQLVKALDDIVMKGLAVGTSFDKLSKELAKRMATSESNAMRLIRTESARLSNAGLLDTYKEMGVEFLTFVATLDDRTSEICSHMDGEIIRIEDAKQGLNVPPLHPYCRSVISPYYGENTPEDRIMRDPVSGKSESKRHQTYATYLAEQLGNKQKAQALISNQNDLRTLTKAIENVEQRPSTADLFVSLALNTTQLMNPTNKQMTIEERRALTKYVSSGYQVLNDNLRRNLEHDANFQALQDTLDTALQKMDYYNGNVKRTLQIEDFDAQEFLKSYEIGDIVTFKEYISTSKNLSENFNTKPNVIYNIVSKSGRDISKHNAMQSEAEVLFERGRVFLVEDIYVREDDNVVIISMREVI